MVEKTKEVIDMTRYVKSEPIHEKCVGCKKVFDFHYTQEVEGEDGKAVEKEFTQPTCKVYIRPAMWWEEKSVATRKKLVVDRDNPRGILVDVPIINQVCPVATHVKVEETATGIKLNPIKASKRGGK